MSADAQDQTGAAIGFVGKTIWDRSGKALKIDVPNYPAEALNGLERFQVPQAPQNPGA
jgi:hypothetical protein